MQRLMNSFLAGGISLIACSAAMVPLQAQAAPVPSTPSDQAASSEGEQAGVTDIVVTAQKRSESINNVGMSINAVTSDALLQRGITNTADLVKAVPGFTYTQSLYGAPVYTIRGIGLFDAGIASSPAVTTYVDEVPLPFPIMSQGAGLDLERVEILKGPQGTLFGQNSTGGAINYIAAKPTSTFEAGATATYERFDKIDVSGFVSGPLSSTVNARLAVRAIEGGAWQTSITRPGDRLGDTRQLQGRLLLDWQASDRLKFSLNLNGFRDNSDTMAGQLIAYIPQVPGLEIPALVANPPIGTSNARQADWDADQSLRMHNRFYQAALRGEYELSDTVKVTSITSYEHQKIDQNIDLDATSYNILKDHSFGTINAFSQELRLSGDTGKMNWLLGANYDHTNSDDNHNLVFPLATFNQPFFGAPSPLGDIPRISSILSSVTQHSNTYSAFGHIEYQITDRLKFNGGLRYTHATKSGVNCSSGDAVVAATFTALQQVAALGLLPGQTIRKTTPVVQIQPGQCYMFTALPDFSPGAVYPRLSEDNVSWRGGLEYKTDGGTLVYGNVSRGWKAGIISSPQGTLQVQYVPARQERVDAYEVGFKAPLFGRKVRLNGAAFYYAYKDKQIRGRFIDPVFGPLEIMQNIPKSRVWGLEGDIVVQPVKGLDLSAGLTYLNSKITSSFDTANQAGVFADYQGSPLPFTPKISAVADAQYRFPISGNVDAFVGSSLTYHGRDNATFRTDATYVPAFSLKAYALVDLRAGIAGPGDSWRVTVFGRNITNEYYWTAVSQQTDSLYRYAGHPATYGLTVSIRTR